MDLEVKRFLHTIPAGGIIIDIGGCWGWHWRTLNNQSPISWLNTLLRREYINEGWVEGMYWLARASQKQKECVERIFETPVHERWSEIIYSPEQHFPYAGTEGAFLGKLDSLLSNYRGFLRWIARQHSFHCKKH